MLSVNRILSPNSLYATSLSEEQRKMLQRRRSRQRSRSDSMDLHDTATNPISTVGYLLVRWRLEEPIGIEIRRWRTLPSTSTLSSATDSITQLNVPSIVRRDLQNRVSAKRTETYPIFIGIKNGNEKWKLGKSALHDLLKALAVSVTQANIVSGEGNKPIQQTFLTRR